MERLKENWIFVAIVVLVVVGVFGLFFVQPRYGRALDRTMGIDPTTGRSEYHEQIMDPRGTMDVTETDLYRQNIIIIENQQRILQQQEEILRLLGK